MEQLFSKIRRYENMHILFWLIKDMSWSMGWKTLGVVMIFPTLIVSIIVAKYFRRTPSEWYHNLAVIAWILANSYWMISEFYEFEELYFWGPLKYVHLALIPFGGGILLILYYHIFLKRLEEK